MRERSTWNLKEVAKKAAEVAGDIYTMNQDRTQPDMDEYVIGDSSDFAEDVQTTNTWEAEYSGGVVKRNELGMPEMRSDTFNHAEKTASDRVRLKKAELCVAVAKLMMRGKKTASTDAIEDQAVALMYMPDSELINTHRRLAQQQQQQDDSDADDDDFDDADDIDDDGEEQQQATKRAGQVPPQFKENIEKMKAKAKDSDDDDDDDDEGQSKQAGQVPPQFKENIEKMKAKSQDSDDDDDDDDDGQAKQASDDDGADTDDAAPARLQNKLENKADAGRDKDKEDQNKTASKVVKTIKRAMGQQQQLMAQMQQLLQQAMGQQDPAQQQEPVAGLTGPALAQQQQQLDPVADDLDLLLDDGADLGPIGEADIEIDPTGLETENVVLAGEDEILRSLFAQDQSDDDDDEDQGQSQAQAKQAGVRRTASTRTVGTRPTAGVTKLGGSVSKTASAKQVDSLSSLWASAPDVRSAFGLK